MAPGVIVKSRKPALLLLRAQSNRELAACKTLANILLSGGVRRPNGARGHESTSGDRRTAVAQGPDPNYRVFPVPCRCIGARHQRKRHALRNGGKMRRFYGGTKVAGQIWTR